MKKLTALIMAVVLCIGLTACAQKSQDVKNTEVMIRAIGTVTEQSGEDIVTAEKFYNKLPDEEKSQVSNYKDLVKAREEYNKLIHYGHWVQYFDKEAVTFVLNNDGSFQMSDGRFGSFEITDSFVVLKTSDGETITFDKVTDKNLVHLKNGNADYIRPDLLTVDRHKIVSSSWYRYFDFYYHVHTVKGALGMVEDYWYSLQLVPKDEYADIIAPGTEVSLTYTYTTRDIATMHNPLDDTLLLVKELTDPVEHSATAVLPYEAFVSEECCSQQYDLARGTTSPYEEFKLVYKTLEYIENPTAVEFEGWLYYYDQLRNIQKGELS